MNILYVIRDMSFVEPLGIMFLSAIAKQDGHKSSLSVTNEENIFLKIEREQPDMICLSFLSVDRGYFKILAEKIKNRYPDIVIAVGGPHATFDAEEVRVWPVDVVIQGEGEWSFRDILRAVDAGQTYDRIENVSTQQTMNPLRRLIEPLDLLPHPDRALVYFPGGHLARLNVKTFMTSRGCAYRCAYCFNSKYKEIYKGNGRTIRRFSVDYIIEEIEQVKADYGLDFVRFGDDVFVYKVDEWLLEFKEKYSKRIGLPFYCLCQVNQITPELIFNLRSAGCHSIGISIETANETLRREVLMRPMSTQTILDAFKNIHEAGIYTYANAMVGLPNATIEDEIQTIELSAECKSIYPSFSVFTPFRGTMLGEKCFKQGLIDGDYPTHTTRRSILNCFSKKQKDIQLNIVYLGMFAVRFPFIKRLILEYLIYIRPNPVFFLAWYFLKNYVSAKYIWPISISFMAKIRLAVRSLAYELCGRLSWGLLLKRK